MANACLQKIQAGMPQDPFVIVTRAWWSFVSEFSTLTEKNSHPKRYARSTMVLRLRKLREWLENMLCPTVSVAPGSWRTESDFHNVNSSFGRSVGVEVQWWWSQRATARISGLYEWWASRVFCG